MKRVLLLVAVLSVFLHVGVAYASGPVGSVPPPQYPNWGCTGTCNSANGDWSLTAGSSMVTNVASLYSNENVVIDVNDLVVPSNACIDITVDTLHICTSANGLYPWTFSNVSGSYHQIQIFCSTACQGNYLVSVLPISAPSPTPTPNPSFTATPTPLVPPTVTPPVVNRITHTPTVSPTPCVADAWGCDQPATATYVACESGVVVNYGLDPCATPTIGPSSTPTATSVPSSPGAIDCGQASFPVTNCNQIGSGALIVGSPHSGNNWVVTGNQECVNGATGGPYGNSGSSASVLLYSSTSGGNCSQSNIRAGFTGFIHMDFSANQYADSNSQLTIEIQSTGGNWGISAPGFASFNVSGVNIVHGDYATILPVVAGNYYDFALQAIGGSSSDITINSIWVVSTAPTTTPLPSFTATAGPTWTPRPTSTPVPARSPTNTPIGYVAPTATILANIDTCLGTIQDCNLALTPIAGKIGGIPGLIATPMAPLNTSVFSPFQTIGITRGGCLSFGKLPVMIPHILWLASPVPVRGGPTATPNISGYVPISVTWTLPTVVGTPMRQGNFGPVDPLEFEPCNDPAIPTWGWDLSWNASTFFEWVGFFVWTVVLIRRIFG